MNENKRICPSCGFELVYKSKYNRNAAEKLNKICQSCSSKKRCEKYGSNIDIINQQVKNGERLNGFFGKNHTVETKTKIGAGDKSHTKTNKFREKISNVTKGEKNPMYGKNFYELWVIKYGKEIADIKLLEFKEKLSNASKGEKNPMYNKPIPKGSGNGWSGWYKKWFFRSLNELSYMINVIERFNLSWETAENKKYKIKYIGFDGQNRTHVCDFLIGKKYLVEIKPKKLINSKTVLLKSAAAIEFCKKNNLIYKITNSPKLTNEDIKQLVDDGHVKFIKKYQIKYNEKFK